MIHTLHLWHLNLISFSRLKLNAPWLSGHRNLACAARHISAGCVGTQLWAGRTPIGAIVAFPEVPRHAVGGTPRNFHRLKKKKGAAGRFSSSQASSNTCKVCAHAAPHDWQRWLGVWECVALKRKKKCWHHFFAADARRPKGVPPVFVVFRNKDTQLLSLPVFSRRRPAEETLGLVSVVGDHTHCDDQIAELHEIKYKYLVFVLSTDTFICTSLDNFSFWRLLTSTSYICTQVSVLHTPYIGNKTCIAFVFKKDPSVLSKKYVP